MTTLTDLFAGHRAIDLSRPYVIGMPQSPNHPRYWHSLPRRHGDTVRADGGSAANDVIMLGTHVGTHMDALAHVSHDGLLHGGIDAAAASVGDRSIAPGASPRSRGSRSATSRRSAFRCRHCRPASIAGAAS